MSTVTLDSISLFFSRCYKGSCITSARNWKALGERSNAQQQKSVACAVMCFQTSGVFTATCKLWF